ncbi:MAG: hypothetical protein R2774_01435 [Saprospiraceae bacterium]
MKHLGVLLTFFFGIGVYSPLTGQNVDMWSKLSKVTFKTSFNPELMMETSVVSLSESVEDLNGEIIEIEGFIIPLSGQVSQSHFMFSRFPQSTCFFCGKAGPESAMQVFMKNGKKVKITERKVKVQGRLLINPKDANSLLYSLDNATILEI